ncbi:MAG: radical SAM protein, partial [Candidatus Hodarchaeales archaeon]
MQVIWDITRQCNLKCKFCYASTESQQELEELTWETIRDKILPKFDELGVDAVCFSGGEPTLQWDLLIRLTKVFARKKYEFLVLTTNTTRLTEDMLKEWKNAARGVKDLILAVPVDSLDPDKVRELRPSSSKIDVLESVKLAADTGIKLGMWVSISTAVTRTNFNEIHSIAEFVRSKGKKAISEMYPCYLEGRAKDNKDLILTKEQFREFDRWRLTNLSKNILFWDFMPFPVNP